MFRKVEKDLVQHIIKFVYELDVLECLAGIVKSNRWCFPEYITDEVQHVLFEGLYHPSIDHAVNNDFKIDSHTNVVFLTGPNMAGKSSFLKAVGVAIYLSHLGFPVPAAKMQTPVFKGLITTINLPDNLQEGLSHFIMKLKE